MSVGVGIIGAGVMGIEHAQLMATQVFGAHLAMVADPDTKRAAAASKSAKVTSDPLALIYDSSVDAIIIASPDESHFGLLRAAIAAEKPVLCEKPLTANSTDALEIVRLEGRLGRRLIQTGFMRRFDPAYREMKDTLDEGKLGNSMVVHCIHRNASAPTWFTGQMAITNALVHEIDICRWLLGDEFVSAIAIPSNANGPLIFVLETAGGKVVTAEVFMNAKYGYDVHAEVVCSDGSISLAHPGLTKIRQSGANTQAYAPNWIPRFRNAYRIQAQKWVESLSKGDIAKSAASSMDGLAATFVAEHVVKALETRQRVVFQVPTG
jgi:myo-inositol 2-dehydrogenase/D-chiro-inositol 1-dehydrogenase